MTTAPSAPNRVVAIATLFGLVIGVPCAAQSASVSGDARIAVPAIAVVRSISHPLERARSRDHLETTTEVVLDANTRYLVRARIAATPAPGSRVLVRDADGVYQPLTPGATVTVAAEQRRGHTTQTIGCRVESSDQRALDPARCTLVYDFFTSEGDVRLASATGPQ